jgi:YVTN family beta-propeller protein
VAITPDGSRAYVANRGNSTVSVIDTATNEVSATIPVGIGPSISSTSIAVTPDGSRAYVTYDTDFRVAVIDTDPASPTFNRQLRIITTTGGKLKEITVVSDGSLAFVNSSTTDEMLIIDVDPGSPNFNTQLGAVSVGDLPVGVVFQDLPLAVAYVSNFGDGTVSVVGVSIIEVTIDIKPGSFPNSINPRGRGRIPVAILSSAHFDAPAEVATTSLTFGRTGDERSLGFCNSSPEDVDGDGLLDLVCHFTTLLTGFQPGDTEGVLKGQTGGGTPLMGADSVRIVP